MPHPLQANGQNLSFKQATNHDQALIFSWLGQSHVQAFWDNSQAHKDDILNFMSGRKSPSTYCDGKVVYWVAALDQLPFAMLMTIQETQQDDIGETKKAYLSKTGHSYGIDFMIGEPSYIGKGLAAPTLRHFVHFLQTRFDQKADTFIIDPAADNPRAKHVYEKAGFEHVADFVLEGDYSGAGKNHHLLIKKL